MNQRLTDIRRAQLDQLLSGGTNMAGGGLLKAVAKAAKPAEAAAALRVYHGSPHRMPPTPENPLGKFDATKIGTGQGAQTYGEGHYLAQARKVAQTYQPRSPLHEEKLLKEYNRAQAKSDYPKMEVLEDAMLHKSLDEIVEKYSNLDDGFTPEHAKAAAEYAKWYEKNQPEVGGLYHVDLPEERIANMLDYDKPINQQSEQVKALLEKAGINTDSSATAGSMIGGQENHLSKHGIPGIKYYDENSRSLAGWEVGKSGNGTWMLKNHQMSPNQWKEFATQEEAIAAQNAMPDVGTRNFVIFPGHEDIANIVKREKKGGLVHLAGGGDPRKRGLFPKMSTQAIVDSPGFDPEVPSDLSRAYARRMAEKDAYQRSIADQKLTPAQRAVAGAEATGMIGSALFEGVQQLPKLLDGEEAYTKAVGEGMYQPRFQPEKAAEYAGNVGDFLEKLETEYKMPALTPELMPFIGAAEAAKQQSKRAVKQGALTAASRMDAGPKAGSRAAQRGVVKMPGGNFLTGRVEKDVAPFKASLIVGETPAQRIPRHEELLKDPSLNQDQLDRVKYQLEETKKDAALDKWVDSNLSNYIKKQMGTPDDPVRALAEQGITHKADLLREDQVFADKPIMDQRREAGFPEEGMAQSPLAKAWEYVSDSSIASHRAGDIQEMPGKFTKRDEAERKMIAARDALYDKFVDHLKLTGISEDQANYVARETPFDLKARAVGDQDFLRASIDYQATNDPMMSSYITLGRENPWIAKVAPETQVYSPYTGDLGFDHIVDVLKQDVAEGRIRPEQLSKVSMEQAVRRTYEYDQEMAKKMAETQAKVTEGMPVYKEYPEGYKWIELSAGEKVKPKVVQLDDGSWTVEDTTGHQISGGFKSKQGAENALAHFSKSDKRYQEGIPETKAKALEDALKYEGDTMGHCVGGYCPDVIEGRSRIYSLRDAKGEPHVTVEVAPNSKPYPVSGEAFAMLPSKTKAEYGQYVREWRQRNPDIEELTDEHTTQALKEAGVPPQPDRIVQIKGKQNRAPKEEYIPFVQDFVRGGNWSDVGDLRNTGLRATSDAFNETEQAFLKSKGVELKPYIDPEETARYQELFKQTPPAEGMAGGGSVGLKNALNNLLRTDKPEVHMGFGGFLAKPATKAAPKAAKAAKKVEHPLVFPRAVPKSLEEIRPIAQRMAEQMTGEFVKQNPKLTTNPAGKSRKQFEREQNIPLETRNVVPERAAPDVNYEDYMGYGVVGVPGDPTLGGVAKRGSLEEVAQPTVELTRVGDITPDYPVPLFGGPRYGDDEKFWSSNFGAAVPIQKNASKLADEYQSPIIAKYIKMGSGSENFALHNLDALLAIQRPERLDKDKMARLTEVIQAGSPKYGKFPGFTGFEEPIDVLLQAQMDSNLRKHIAETLTKPTITNELGLANGLDVVAAITHPELRNLETGASGFSVGKMKPGAKLQRGESSHPTYDTDIPGSFLGRSKYPTPYEIAFPDTTAYARSRMTPGVQEFNMLKMLGPRERIDQQYIDEIKMYEELMKKYTGKKKGGLAQIKKVKRHGNTVPH
jgi:hypothetical protein